MSQHDMNIANQTSSSARTDINNALEALASVQSGNSAPTTTFPHQLWVDTTSQGSQLDYILKVRNNSNTSWEDLFYFSDAYGPRLVANTPIIDSSSTNIGNLSNNTQAVWNAGSDTTNRLISASKLKDAIQVLAPSGSYQGSISVVEEKPANTGPPTASAGWNNRLLNTIKVNTISGSSLSSQGTGQVSLPTGKYTWSASAFSFLTQGHVLQLYDVSNGISLGQSPNCTMTSGYNGSTAISAEGGFTLANSVGVKLRHWLAVAGDGFGSSLNTGFPNTYATLTINKIST